MGTHDFSRFTMVMRKRAREIESASHAAMRQVGQAATDTIINATPVDTAKAVSNWRAGLTQPTGVLETSAPGSSKGSGAHSARSRSKQGAAAVFKAAENLKADVVFFVNNAPYIGVLNYGDQRHRPHGMVEKGLFAARLAAKSIRILKR